MASEDLIAHFKLEAEVFPEYTLHTSYWINRARGVRETTQKRWERRETLGEGAFGKVWLELHSRSDGSHDARAVKAINKREMRQESVDFKKELLALAKFSKEEYRRMEVLVSLLGWFETDQSVYLAMEYFEHGDLARHIPEISTEDAVRQITVDLLEGLKIMHAEGFAHRDLKPQNIFVVEKPPWATRWWVKIGDFGISKRVLNDDTALRTQTGTRLFQAPEILGFVDSDDETYEYTNSVDIWSLGCIVYNISTQRLPFTKPHEINNFCRNIIPLPTKPLLPKMSKAGIRFIKHLLVPQPAQRITVEGGLKDPWILSMSSPSPQHTLLPNDLYRHSAVNSGGGTIAPLASNDNLHDRNLRSPPEHGSNHIPYKSQISNSLSTTDKRTILSSHTSYTSGQSSTPVRPKASSIPSQSQGRTSLSHSPRVSESYVETEDPLEGWTRYDDTINHVTLPLEPRRANEGSSQPSLRREVESSSTTLSPKAASATLPPKKIFSTDWTRSIKLGKHSDSVSAVAFSPDGQLIASGSYDTTIRLWSTATGQTLSTLSGHSDSVLAVAFSPNGKLIASGSDDKTIRLWDITTGQTLSTLSGHSDWVSAVAFSPDGQLIASSAHDATIRLWSTWTGQTLSTLLGHSDSVFAVAFSPDGKLIASGSYDKMIRLWDTATGQTLSMLSGHSDSVLAVAFSPNGKLIASGSDDKTIRLWDIATGQTLSTLLGHSKVVQAIAFSPDGKLIASGSYGKRIRLWDTATGQAVSTLSGHSEVVHALAFSPDGKLIASGSGDMTIRLWGAVNDRAVEQKAIKPRAVVKNQATKEEKAKSLLRRLFS